METAKPLNSFLYGRLKRRFGEIIVANERQAMVAVRKRDPVLNEMRLEIVSSGEYYRVNCPFCNDTRKRLWVNHRYGLEEPWQDNGERRTLWWVAWCYNEECMLETKNRTLLNEAVFAHVNRNVRSKIRVEEGEKPDTDRRKLSYVDLPGAVTPLHKLDRDHEAFKYMASRGFDVWNVSRRFMLGFCTEADDRWAPCDSRLIIPIYMNGMRVGWQGRFVGEKNWSVIPKYYGMPGMPKGKMLYNWDHASRTPLLVIVEGAPGVWNASPEHGIALLGKKLSAQHLSLIRQWAGQLDGECAIVVALDPDAQDNVEGTLRELRPHVHDRICNVSLPDNHDPGDIDRDFFWELAETSASRAGFDLERYRAA
jgi:hypothetical protein